MTARDVATLLPYLASAFITLWLAILAWRRRSVPGAAPFAGLALSETIWTLAYLLQVVAPVLEGKLFWNDVQFLGAVGAPLMYLGFALEYNRQGHLFRRFSWKLFIPLALLLLAFIWTNGVHGGFRSQPRLEPGDPFPALVYDPGPGNVVYTIYAYSLIVLTTLILVSRYLHATQLYRTQVGIVLAGVLIPWITTIVTMLGWVPTLLHEVTPLTFGISGLVIARSLFRYRLFELVPVARDHLVENMLEGVFVLDSRMTLVDLNPAARGFLRLGNTNPLGQSLSRFLPLEARWLQAIPPGEADCKELILPCESTSRFYEIQASRLDIPPGDPAYLVILRDIQARKEVEDRLHQLAITDPLTGVYNRRYVFQQGQREIERAERLGHELSVILFDLDYFKEINDQAGHKAGDQVLEALAKCCQESLRSFDILGRYGGDEFVIILPESRREAAVEIAERLLALVRQFPIPGNTNIKSLTLSIGVASLGKRPGMTLDRLLQQADQALYRAKLAGRNRVEA